MWTRASIVLATVILSGSQIGAGAAWLASGLLPLERSVPSLPERAAAADEPVPEALAGHLFAPEDPEPGSPPEVDDRTRCDVPWQLVGALVDREDPSGSFVAVHTPYGGRLLGRGGAQDGLTLVALQPGRITLEGEDGDRCVLEIGSSSIAALSEEPAPAPAGVTRVSARHVRVDRAVVRRLASAGPGIRVLPVTREGRVVGVRLSGIRPGSALQAAGARDGDILTEIDGRALTSPEVALGAYAQLLSGAPVRVRVERAGTTFEQTLEVSN